MFDYLSAAFSGEFAEKCKIHVVYVGLSSEVLLNVSFNLMLCLR